MGLYETPAPGERQKKPQIVPQTSRMRGRYHIVRTFERGIAPKGHVAFRGTAEECQTFIDAGCMFVAPKRKRSAKKK
jgi:hypothetical protein